MSKVENNKQDKHVHIGHKSKELLTESIRKATEVVSVTYGPMGRSVYIQPKFGDVRITKDGITVIKSLAEAYDKSPMDKLGISLIVQAAKKTDDTAGDGTTTTSVLVKELVVQGNKFILMSKDSGLSQIGIRKGMENAKDFVISELKKLAKKIEKKDDLASVASLSANGDSEIGNAIADIITEVGKDGIVTVEDSKNLNHMSTEVIQGMHFDRGYVSPCFITDEKRMIAEFDEPSILIMEGSLKTTSQIFVIVELIVATNGPVVIIADELEDEALGILAINLATKVPQLYKKIAVVKSPGFGEKKQDLLQDIAIMTGAQVVAKNFMTLDSTADNSKKKEELMGMIGKAKKVSINKNRTIISEGSADKKVVANRVASINSLMEESNSDYEKEKYKERIAKLQGGIGVIKVGGATESEAKERKDRVIDALNSSLAAYNEGGVVPGGGASFLYIAERLDSIDNGKNLEESYGIKIVKKALLAPIACIVDNAGRKNSAVVIDKLINDKDLNQVFDVRTSKYVNAFDNGIIDPLKVVISALEDSVSVAIMVITTDAIIIEEDEDSQSSNLGGGGMPGGMGGGYM